MESNDKAVAATAKLVAILAELNSEERARAISATMVLLGESGDLGRQEPHRQQSDGLDGLSSKGAAWSNKYGITTDQLEHVFAIEPDGIEVIAARAPGKSKRLQTIESYVLCGLTTFLESGDLSFSDDDARALCKRLGAYDSPNHFNYVRALGNLVAGSKSSGWRLTNPGLARAAEVVKQLCNA